MIIVTKQIRWQESEVQQMWKMHIKQYEYGNTCGCPHKQKSFNVTIIEGFQKLSVIYVEKPEQPKQSEDTQESKQEKNHISVEFVLKSLFKLILAVHMRGHIGEMPYKCNVCDKGFAVKERLRLHSRVHSGKQDVGMIIRTWLKEKQNS